MTKVQFSFLVLVLALGIMFYVVMRGFHHIVTTPPIQNTNSQIVNASRTNAMPASGLPQINNTFNAIGATNLAQWKMAIAGLKQLSGFSTIECWVAEQPDRTKFVQIMLEQDGKTMQDRATFISITAIPETGDIMEVELQTPNMNIDQTRKLGLQLCNLTGLDSKQFLAWCDKVGNHWLDVPLYTSGRNTPFWFKMLRTYSDEKPWFIDLIIETP